MKKLTAKEVLSDISGYSVEELKDRCTEVLIQPYDAELTAVKFAAQEVAEATKQNEVSRKNELFAAYLTGQCDHRDRSFGYAGRTFESWYNDNIQPLPQPPKPNE